MDPGASGGKDEALFLDTEGHCSEATASNLFIATGGVLLTPPLSCAALPGITRATVLELARERLDRGARASLRRIGADRRRRGVSHQLAARHRAVVAVGDATIGDGTPGPLTRRIADAYAALVAGQCATASIRA
jgi:branched-chain amino acid aminotransferase